MNSDHTPKIETFPRRVGGAETLVGVDLQLELFAPHEELPYVNSLRVAARGEDDEPSVDVFPAKKGHKIENRLFVPLAERGGHNAVLVGSIATLASAEWFVYSAEPCAERLAEAVSEQFPHLKVEARAQHDPRWSVYREFLLPSQLERHLIRNRRQVRELAERGESSGKPRPVDHTLWFSSTDDRTAFAESIAGEGFALHYPDEDVLVDAGEGDDVEYGLTISREDTVGVDTMDELVRWLFKEAMRFGGEYEGWHVQH